jgi:hypothetical protein
MSLLKNKKVLLIAAQLFNYEKEIHIELENQGAEVTRYDQRPANDFLTKVFIRLNLKFLIKKKIDNYYKNIIQEISEIDYDYIFLVSPEAIDVITLQKIKNIQKKARIFIYMWDSIKNKRQALSLLPLSDKFFTFDSSDIAINNKIIFLPLFYIQDYQNITVEDKPLYDIAFIGTIHSDRYKIIKDIEELAIKNNLTMYSYFYSPSRLLFWIKKLTDRNFFFIDEKDISYKSLNKENILKIIQNTKSVIDIEHPSQNGLTMRTIEMLGAKRKLLSTNKNIAIYDFFNDSNIYVLDRNNLEIDKDFFYIPYQPLDKNIYDKYSLHSWIKIIFAENIKNKEKVDDYFR